MTQMQPGAKAVLQRTACQCKEMLSTSSTAEYTLQLPDSNMQMVKCCLTQDDLRAALQQLQPRLEAPLQRLADQFKLQLMLSNNLSNNSVLLPAAQVQDRFAPPPRAVSQLVLVGGSTKCPHVSSLAEQLCNCKACTGVDPEHVVALGAALYAGMMQGEVAGMEMTDSVYAEGQHDRVSGFQT